MGKPKSFVTAIAGGSGLAQIQSLGGLLKRPKQPDAPGLPGSGRDADLEARRERIRRSRFRGRQSTILTSPLGAAIAPGSTAKPNLLGS